MRAGIRRTLRLHGPVSGWPLGQGGTCPGARRMAYPVVFRLLADFSQLRLVERKMLFYRGAAGHGV
jgi:hypothetical protein